MSTMTVKEVCEEILSINHVLFDNIYTKKIEVLYADLVFGYKNEELNKSFEVHEPSGYHYTPRKKPLTGNELVEGEYFICDYDGHRPEITLYYFKTQERLEEHLLSDGCILNSYCTFAIPIINKKAKLYSIEYFNTINNTIERLDLRAYKKDHTPDMDEMTQRKVVWFEKSIPNSV